MSRLLRVVPLLVLAVIAGLFVAPAPTARAIGEPTFTNPLAPDTADPDLEYYEGNYYLIATTWTNQILVRRSPTLAGLRTATPVTVWSDTTPGRSNTMWAPDLRRLRGPDGRDHWYLMYTMGGEPQRMNVIESVGLDPMGPYAYKGRPIPTAEWNIDGSYVVLGGQLYVAWSAFSTNPRLQSNYIARMSNPWTADTAMVHLLSQPLEPWERIGGEVNEGPIQLSRGGREHIVYSASGCWTDDYELGMLTWNGGDPLRQSSWTKTGPVFTKAAGAFGPGHNSFFTSPDGTQVWNTYHANPASGQGCGRERTARTQQVTFDGAGTPNFGRPVAPGAAVPVPSGENGPLSPAVQGGRYQLVNRNSGLCALTAGGSTADGGDVVQGTCATTGTATWVLDGTADGFYRLVNVGSRKALDAANCGNADGADVRQFAWLANPCQQWRPAPAADGYVTLTGRASGKALDVIGCNTAVGGNIALWTVSGNACQQWELRPAGAVTVTNQASGKSLDVLNCSAASGAGLQQWQHLGTTCQRFTFTAAGAGFLEIHPTSAPTLCLGVQGASTADGAAVAQGACGAAAAQWRTEPMPDGTSRLVARHSGKVLDLADCGLADGTALRQWSDLGNLCQRFRIAA